MNNIIEKLKLAMYYWLIKKDELISVNLSLCKGLLYENYNLKGMRYMIYEDK